MAALDIPVPSVFFLQGMNWRRAAAKKDGHAAGRRASANPPPAKADGPPPALPQRCPRAPERDPSGLADDVPRSRLTPNDGPCRSCERTHERWLPCMEVLQRQPDIGGGSAPADATKRSGTAVGSETATEARRRMPATAKPLDGTDTEPEQCSAVRHSTAWHGMAAW